MSEYIQIPGLRERIRIVGGYIQGETGWARVATEEEEAMFAALIGSAEVTARSAQNPSSGEGPSQPRAPRRERE